MDSCLIFRREKLGISYSLSLSQKKGVEFIDFSVGNRINKNRWMVNKSQSLIKIANISSHES
jgi:hypothetical protein